MRAGRRARRGTILVRGSSAARLWPRPFVAYLAGNCSEGACAAAYARGLMGESVKARGASRRLAPAGALFALAGLGLFAYFVWRAGPAEIWSNISKIGWGFVAIILLAGLRFAVRAEAWTLCFEEPNRLGV